MLTTAQPNGRLYCTLHRFFFSPAPILPAHTHKEASTVITALLWKPWRFKRHVVLSRIKKQHRNSHLFLWCVQQCRHLFVDHCFPNPAKTGKHTLTSDSIIVNKLQSADLFLLLVFRVMEHDLGQLHITLNCFQSIFANAKSCSRLTTNSVHCLSVFSGDLGNPLLFSLTKNLSLCERRDTGREHTLRWMGSGVMAGCHCKQLHPSHR